MKKLTCLTLGLLAATTLATTAQAEIIKIDGSSTVFPVTEAVAEEFQIATKERVTVGVSGTGGGFKKFCRGETDISNASRPILKAEMDICAKSGVKYFELPVAFDALTVVVNKNNNFVKPLTVDHLKTAWGPESQGKVTSWNQLSSSFPNAPLKLYGPGADSGTFDYFTEAVVGKAKSSRGDYTASEDDHVIVQGLSRDKNGLGYLGYAYYIENKNKLKAVPIVNKQGKVVAPSEANVLNGSYNPLSRPIFIYVNQASLQKPEVKKFVDFYMQKSTPLIKEVKYVPLPAKAYKHNLDVIKKGKLGTVFGGEAQVGLTIEELMKREAKL
ncbi:PstS family phosphate ABC transporter substrate-binding protein [Acinetobacter proteolyticus]|uniref:Phosphate-binding protein n=1 Tax=Acinetobacter proteolyticus TaxID=1776741 RepID=A0A2N0WCB5_9GAMM|nr:PstS family phosphate ABC transporter substrate-binding protein [Acinetobacter proteolyticus]MBK5646653.1 PstS family phosphate ABC transporter substrate-binding protein [Acinetobacter sp.]PKF32148.1 protein sphX [Acinetobacter proteolyticus]